MAEEQSGEKSEQASQKKLEEAHRKGQFAKSAEVQTAFVLMSAMTALAFSGGEMWRMMATTQVSVLSHLHDTPLSMNVMQQYAVSALLLFGRCVWPVCAATMMAGLLAGGIQTRFSIATEAVTLNWEKLSPVQGFKRVFSMQSAMPTGLSVMKLTTIVGLSYSVIHGVITDPIFHSSVDLVRIAGFMADSSFKIVLRVCVTLVVIAAIDYTYQIWKTDKDLKMTRQEVKDESKNSEANPQLKAKMRRKRAARSKRKMLAEVPKADVVVVNPIHIAVALRYDRKTMKAPRVVAKGTRLNAAQIKEIAQQHQVPIIENIPLARMMFKYCPVGGEVPAQLYAAVAEVLAWVYRVNAYRYYREQKLVTDFYDAMAKTKSKETNLGRLFKNGDIFLVAGIFGTVMLMIMPIPPFILDGFLAISIALSLLILLAILYVKDPAEFTGFPTLLLFITLFRLSLNIASTRLILLDGFAGHIIEAFGNFVVRGNYVVGLVIFLILVLINFIVITKGAGRIAEVAARFTLDAMPGKQMAIDAELNAGMINELEARTRRRKVEQEADFYGAMDGASKFVRGDAIAAILITLINVLGGFAIGILQKHMSVGEALQRFTLLSIGDGLVSQIPALITSTAAGILVTRAATKEELGKELTKQLLAYPRVLAILTVMLGVFALVPGLPMIPFLFLGSVTGFLAFSLKGQDKASINALTGSPAEPNAAGGDAAAKAAAGPVGDKLEALLNVDVLQIELGFGLVTLADARKGGDLLDRVTGVRKTFAQEMGVIIPPIRLRDNLQLDSNVYRFLLKGNTIAQGQLMPGHWLAMNAGNSKTVLKGLPTVEPVFKLPATWVSDVERKNAEVSGYTVVDAASVLVTHLSETVKRNCHDILSRQDVQALLDNLKQTNATVVTELIPAQLNVGQVQRILQNLLAEGISIRNLAGILEKVSDYAAVTKNPDELSEHARRALGSQIVKPFQDQKGALQAITLDPRLEQQIAQGVRQSSTEVSLTMEPKLARHVTDTLSQRIQKLLTAGQPPIVMCAPQLRLAFRRFFETAFAELTVLSYSEVPSRVEIQSAGIIPSME